MLAKSYHGKAWTALIERSFEWLAAATRHSLVGNREAPHNSGAAGPGHRVAEETEECCMVSQEHVRRFEEIFGSAGEAVLQRLETVSRGLTVSRRCSTASPAEPKISSKRRTCSWLTMRHSSVSSATRCPGPAAPELCGASRLPTRECLVAAASHSNDRSMSAVHALPWVALGQHVARTLSLIHISEP